jgi:uncharacterized membrane protein
LRDRGLEKLLGLVLLTGFALGLTVMSIGIVLYLVTYGRPEIELGGVWRTEYGSIFAYLTHINSSANPKNILELGLALLLLTPYARAVASIAYFIAEHDLKYVIITSIVIALIT